MLCNQNYPQKLSSLNPTLIAKKFVDEFQEARWIAIEGEKSWMEIFPCIPIGWENTTFLASKGSCKKDLPVAVGIGNEQKNMYINTLTLILAENSEDGPCAQFGEQIIRKNAELIKVNQINGQSIKIPEEKIIIIAKGPKWVDLPKIDLKTFKAQIITKLKNPNDYLGGQFKQYGLSKVDDNIVTPEKEDKNWGAKIIPKSLWPSFLDWGNLKDEWITFICGLMSLIYGLKLVKAIYWVWKNYSNGELKKRAKNLWKKLGDEEKEVNSSKNFQATHRSSQWTMTSAQLPKRQFDATKASQKVALEMSSPNVQSEAANNQEGPTKMLEPPVQREVRVRIRRRSVSSFSSRGSVRSTRRIGRR